MPPVRPFRISLYLSLGIAVGAIGVAGGDLLPEIPYITVFCLLLLGVAYALEGRFELSLRDANIVGLFMVALLGLWVVFQFVRAPTGLADTLPWPASALPYLAPVLMLLIPAKLLRPKHVGDYWTMHGLGLLAIALACALASEGGFVFVFGLYAVTFVWSLMSFHLYRELGPELARGAALSGGRWRAARPAILWAGIAAAVAIPLFWMTPRTGSQWELGINARGRLSGLAEGPVDLNTTGPITMNRERAFEVFAEGPDGRPWVDLSPEQRWRATALRDYQDGRWVRNQFSFTTADRTISSPLTLTSTDARQRLPDLGPASLYLSFSLVAKLNKTPPLADPVAWRVDELPPVVSRTKDGYRSWVQRHDGAMDGSLFNEGGPPQYSQVWTAPTTLGSGPAMRIQIRGGGIDPFTRITRLPRLKAYSDQLVERLVAGGALPANVLTDIDPATQVRLPQHHEAIARAFERHLASSGEFSYSLDLTRQDKLIDPAEDFVLNTKTGHCQRFATALALMLRSQGIPSQLVLGYRGCEGRGDGWYDIREDHAHAWVEILLAAPSDELVPVWKIAPGIANWWPALRWAELAGGAIAAAALPLPNDWPAMHWVTLDPTPSGGGLDGKDDPSLLSQARRRWEAVLKAFLLAYNQESREQAAEALKTWVTEDNGAFYLAGGGLGLLGIWTLRRRSARRNAEAIIGPASLRRLVAALKRVGIEWPQGQTAREFARSTGDKLRGSPATAAVAELPEAIVIAYYAERFGDLAPGPDERRELDARLTRLEAALR
jgi:protein-glutamine gamma-glutamyltransferase